MLRMILKFLPMLLMLASLLSMGTGYGLHLSLLGLFVCLLGSNFSTAGVFCLLFGTRVLGYVFAYFGLPGWGGDIAVMMGLLLLHIRYPLGKVIGKSKNSILLLAWCELVLLFFYYYGPQNAYANFLVINFLKYGVISFFAFFYCFRDKTLNWRQLGLLGIFSGLVYLAVGGKISPMILPRSILDIGYLRIMNSLTEPIISNHDLAILANLGFMFVYSSNAVIPKNRYDNIILLSSLFVTIILVGWSGARQGIFFLALGGLSILACKGSATIGRFILPITVIGTMLYMMLQVSILQDFSFFATLLDRNQDPHISLNRDINFDAAIWLFKQKPLLGYGLGGYYVPGYTVAGEGGMYAHNFLLDMLSQMGIVGTIIFFSPLFLTYRFRAQIRHLLNFQNGNAILPVFAVFFLHSLISGSFIGIAQSIVLVAALPLVRQTKLSSMSGADKIAKMPGKKLLTYQMNQ